MLGDRLASLANIGRISTSGSTTFSPRVPRESGSSLGWRKTHTKSRILRTQSSTLPRPLSSERPFATEGKLVKGTETTSHPIPKNLSRSGRRSKSLTNRSTALRHSVNSLCPRGTSPRKRKTNWLQGNCQGPRNQNISLIIK